MKTRQCLLRMLFPLATLAIAAAPVVGGPLTGGAGMSPVAEVSQPAAATDSTDTGGTPSGDLALGGFYAPVLAGGLALEPSRSIVPYVTSGLAVAAIAAPVVLLSRGGSRDVRAPEISDAFHSSMVPTSPGDPGDGTTIDPLPLELNPYEPPEEEPAPIVLPAIDPSPLDPPAVDMGPWVEQAGPGPGRNCGPITETPAAALLLTGLAALGLSLRRLG